MFVLNLTFVQFTCAPPLFFSYMKVFSVLYNSNLLRTKIQLSSHDNESVVSMHTQVIHTRSQQTFDACTGSDISSIHLYARTDLLKPESVSSTIICKPQLVENQGPALAPSGSAVGMHTQLRNKYSERWFYRDLAQVKRWLSSYAPASNLLKFDSASRLYLLVTRTLCIW